MSNAPMYDATKSSDESAPFEWEGQLTEDDAEDLAEQVGLAATRGSAAISTPFRAPSTISINQRSSFPLADLLNAQKQSLSPDIQLQIDHYDFYQVNLVCVFKPAAGCRFSDADFSLALQTIPTPAKENAIAYDLFPLKTEDQVQVTVKKSLDPELKLSPNLPLVGSALSASVSLPVWDKDEQYIRYNAQIQGYLVDTNPSWGFKRTPSHEIDGSYSLFLLVRKPKGTQVQITPSLTAHVQFMLGSLPLDPRPLALRRKGDQPDLVDKPFLLF